MKCLIAVIGLTIGCSAFSLVGVAQERSGTSGAVDRVQASIDSLVRGSTCRKMLKDWPL